MCNVETKTPPEREESHAVTDSQRRNVFMNRLEKPSFVVEPYPDCVYRRPGGSQKIGKAGSSC